MSAKAMSVEAISAEGMRAEIVDSETGSAGTGDAIAPTALQRLAPYVVPRSDRVLPILIGASLVVHATIFLPSLFHRDAREAPRQEIPVEIVQLPPKPAEQPKAPAPKPLAPKPPAQKQAAAQPAPKPPAQKPQVAQKAAPKPQPKQQIKPQPKQVAQKAPEKPQQPNGEARMKQLLGPMPAIALPGASANGGESVDYSQLVLSQVAKAKKQGRYNGVPGAASVAFTLGNAGEVVSVKIVRPSGDASLDDEAVAMVKRGAPYPPPPPGGRRDYAITLRFQALL